MDNPYAKITNRELIRRIDQCLLDANLRSKNIDDMLYANGGPVATIRRYADGELTEFLRADPDTGLKLWLERSVHWGTIMWNLEETIRKFEEDCTVMEIRPNADRVGALEAFSLRTIPDGENALKYFVQVATVKALLEMLDMLGPVEVRPNWASDHALIIDIPD